MHVKSTKQPAFAFATAKFFRKAFRTATLPLVGHNQGFHLLIARESSPPIVVRHVLPHASLQYLHLVVEPGHFFLRRLVTP
jgi:hypothetical protein